MQNYNKIYLKNIIDKTKQQRPIIMDLLSLICAHQLGLYFTLVSELNSNVTFEYARVRKIMSSCRAAAAPGYQC